MTPNQEKKLKKDIEQDYFFVTNRRKAANFEFSDAEKDDALKHYNIPHVYFELHFYNLINKNIMISIMLLVSDKLELLYINKEPIIFRYYFSENNKKVISAFMFLRMEEKDFFEIQKKYKRFNNFNEIMK